MHSWGPSRSETEPTPHPVWERLPDLSLVRRLGEIAAEQPQQAGWYNLYQSLREEPVLCETEDFQIIPFRVTIGARSRALMRCSRSRAFVAIVFGGLRQWHFVTCVGRLNGHFTV